MAEPFLGEIRMFGGNFAPTGWALCNGQLLPIQQNTALFSILGTTFGGNGTTNFALPNLQGRVPVHMGQGSGLSNYILGETAGVESVTLQVTQMPAHTHALNASTTPGSSASPQNGVPASGVDSQGGSVSGYVPSPNTTMAANAVGMAGSSIPHENRQPLLCVNFIIALQGIFPSRN
jgi:microcystin-dependent protein